MPRNMSFMLTTDQIRDRSKTVTRRNGWTFLKPGDLVWAVEKAMGLKKGENVKRLALLRVLSNQRVQLDTITGSDCVREGFPEMTAAEFVDFYCRYNAVKPDALVSRIEFEYVEDYSADESAVANNCVDILAEVLAQHMEMEIVKREDNQPFIEFGALNSQTGERRPFMRIDVQVKIFGRATQVAGE